MGRGNCLGNGQAQPIMVPFAVPCGIGAVKPFKKLFLLGFWYLIAVIGNREEGMAPPAP